MTPSMRTRTAARGAGPVARAALVVLGAALLASVGLSSLSSFSATSSADTLLGTHRLPAGAAAGDVPDGVTAFDDEYPAVAGLDAALLAALRQATTDAARDEVDLQVTSGWRSAAYQRELLDEAVAEHGSVAAAARWVVAPEDSRHVSGDAVDVGGLEARLWLAQHGDRHGLCLVYDNEPWHFELRPGAVRDGCPATYPDPTQDPRVR